VKMSVVTPCGILRSVYKTVFSETLGFRERVLCNGGLTHLTLYIDFKLHCACLRKQLN
jgi:hypothetical protein